VTHITAVQVTDIDVEAADAQAAEVEAHWWWYLVAGIIAVLLGFIVLSWRTQTLYVITYFAGAMFLFGGVVRVLMAIAVKADRWISLLGGILFLAVGVIILVWPKPTLFVVALLIALGFTIWGVLELVAAFTNVHARHWWISLIAGIVSLAIAVWTLRHPGNALNVIIILLGIWMMLWGVIEIVGAFMARHAVTNWNRVKSSLL
jgi:uncharacterized membrane protein HdeD (DUF308 family)